MRKRQDNLARICRASVVSANSVDSDARNSLVEFYQKLSNTNSPVNPVFGWNFSSDPCKDQWRGIVCDSRALFVRRILLDASDFTGIFDSSIICNVPSLVSSLTIISLSENWLTGSNLDDIAKCKHLTHLAIGGNGLSGSLPDSLSSLNNLKLLNISWNLFSGDLPDLSQISGLRQFFAEKNSLTGPLPDFNFLNFLQFNVSSNNFTGGIPKGGGRLPASSFIGNPKLCGDPLPNKCLPPDHPKKKSKSILKNQILMRPPPPDHPKKKSKPILKNQILIYIGFILIGLAILLIIIFKLCRRGKRKEEKVDSVNNVASFDKNIANMPSAVSSEYKLDQSKTDVSGVSIEGASSSLVVLTSPKVNGLKFEELLRAPAELMGRGKHGTVYKVIYEHGLTLAVKRIRDWTISSQDFKERMKRLDQVKHPNVLPAAAFYCSMQEKLLVYEYQPNGSLSALLNGTRMGKSFEWSSRLGFAATVSNALAYMHKELCKDEIAHGNLRSSNILLNKNMDPVITEYGLMEINNDDNSLLGNFSGPKKAFKSDVYGLGVVLLELLTGKTVQTNGTDLAKWVLSVVQEEWTVEVFDKSLIQEGASEVRMVNLLQIAVKCFNCSPETRPGINQVAMMINTLKEEEERSLSSES